MVCELDFNKNVVWEKPIAELTHYTKLSLKANGGFSEPESCDSVLFLHLPHLEAETTPATHICDKTCVYFWKACFLAGNLQIQGNKHRRRWALGTLNRVTCGSWIWNIWAGIHFSQPGSGPFDAVGSKWITEAGKTWDGWTHTHTHSFEIQALGY